MLIDPYDPVIQFCLFFGICTLGTCTLDDPHVVPLLDHQLLRVRGINPQYLQWFQFGGGATHLRHSRLVSPVHQTLNSGVISRVIKVHGTSSPTEAGLVGLWLYYRLHLGEFEVLERHVHLVSTALPSPRSNAIRFAILKIQIRTRPSHPFIPYLHIELLYRNYLVSESAYRDESANGGL